jgi:hypothetical protein
LSPHTKPAEAGHPLQQAVRRLDAASLSVLPLELLDTLAATTIDETHLFCPPELLARNSRADAIRNRSRQKVGILADALAHRHIVIFLWDNDLRCDD